MAREQANRSEEGYSLRQLGEIALAWAQNETAETHFLESIRILSDLADEYDLALVRLALARLRVSQNQSDQARALAGQAIETFQRLGAALDLAQARAIYDSL